MNAIERIKMVKAMEFICRNLNNEEIFEGWLVSGVEDGDIDYGDLSVEPDDRRYVMDFYVSEDENFADLMDTFLNRMFYAYKDGGLYCDGVVSRAKPIPF